METTAAAAKIQTIRDQTKQLRAEVVAGLEQAKREAESIIHVEACYD